MAGETQTSMFSDFSTPDNGGGDSIEILKRTMDELALKHEYSTQVLEVETKPRRGARKGDGSRITVATRSTQHRDKNKNSTETPIVKPSEESEKKPKSFWWQQE